MLEQKWPSRYNSFGHITWHGKIYGSGFTLPILLRPWRVYHGVWGQAPFQSLYQDSPGLVRSLPLMPEWYLIMAALLVLLLPAILWHPLLVLLPLVIVTFVAPSVQALITASGAELREVQGRPRRIRSRLVIAALHLLQPIMRLKGRIGGGLTLWRTMVGRAWAWPEMRLDELWREAWADPSSILSDFEATLRDCGATYSRGGAFDRWDLQVRAGQFGHVRVLMAVEEHGGGRQLYRIAARPMLGHLVLLLGALLFASCALAVMLGYPTVLLVMAGLLGILGCMTFAECGAALGIYDKALSRVKDANA
jgi:hypothetical protein